MLLKAGENSLSGILIWCISGLCVMEVKVTLSRLPKLSLFTLGICVDYGHATELNLDFIQNTTVIPAVLLSDSAYPQGKYSVDVVVNDSRTGHVELNISEEEEKNNALCLSSQWLDKAGVMLNIKEYDDVYDNARNCYILSNNPHTQLLFDYSAQKLIFSVPQAYLLSNSDPARWDYGVSGGRMKYYANFNTTDSEGVNAFGDIELGFNKGRWVFSGNVNAFRDDDDTEFTSRDLTLSTAISQIRGDLFIGKSQTRTELFSDFNFYGISVRSNSHMRPWEERGYAPDITGIATTPSRITVEQNGYTVYSRMIPAGPYRLDDLRPTGNGDLLVTVEDDRGRKSVQVYPVTTLPTLLRSGDAQYNLAVGKKNKSNELEKAFSSESGVFWLGSFDYGFSRASLNTALILNNHYQSAGIGMTNSLGQAGAFSVSVASAKASYDQGKEKKGQSISLKYAKNISNRTDLQLLTYRYQNKGYVDYADFNPQAYLGSGQHKSRYEARLSHRFSNAWLSGSYWEQDYWHHDGRDVGSMVSLSTFVLDYVSLFLNGAYTQYAGANSADYAASLSISIPFDFGGLKHYSNNSVGYSRNEGTAVNTRLSARVNDRFNYELGANASSAGHRGASASASYAFDAIQTNIGVSQTRSSSGDAQTRYSGSASGSVLATRETGLLFTKESSRTVAIVNVSGVEGITFNSSMPTDRNGNTVVWLSEYAENNISLNMGNVPDDMEFETTSYKVVPTEKALVYRKFGFENVLRYILRVKDKQGKYLTGGEATTEQGLNAGLISANGVLLINMLAEPKTIEVNRGKEGECSFSMKGFQANSNKVQEVICE